MNEPHDQDTAKWLKTANSTIAALRDADVTSHVLLPGGNYSNAGVWMATVNKDLVQTVVDPLKRTLIDVHLYFDR